MNLSSGIGAFCDYLMSQGIFLANSKLICLFLWRLKHTDQICQSVYGKHCLVSSQVVDFNSENRFHRFAGILSSSESSVLSKSKPAVTSIVT